MPTVQTPHSSYVPLPEPEESLTKKIIGAAFEVHNELGSGLMEALYERALKILLEEKGLNVETQVRGQMTFRGHDIGQFIADMVVERKIVVELKSAEAIVDAHSRQVLNYARVLELRAGLVLNFGPPKVGVRRVVNPRFGREVEVTGSS